MIRNYVISGNGECIFDEDEADELCDKLGAAIDNNDFAKYENLVNYHAAILNEFCCDFWSDMFSEGSNGEILFWINYPGWRLSVIYLAFLQAANEDLFQLGMN
jgi:hypothetical protein